MPAIIARGCSDHEGRRLPPQRLRPDGRAHRRALDDRARPGRERRRARQPLRRRPPQRAGSLLPERPDARPPARRVGRPARRARCSCLPLWHPVLLAEQIGTLASIAAGPFIMQCALGGGAEQFDAFGVSMRDAAVAVRGRARHRPPPVRGRRSDAPTAPCAIDAGAHRAGPARAARGVDRRRGAARDRPRRAARRRVPDRARSDADAGARARRRPTARRARATAGRRPGSRCGATCTSAPTTPTPRASPGPILDRGYRGFDPAAPVVGGAERVAAAFADLGELGCTDVIIRHLADDHGEVLASFERLGAVRAAVGVDRL